MRRVLFLLATGLLFMAAGLPQARGQEKKKPAPTGVMVRVTLEDIKVKGDQVFLTVTDAADGRREKSAAEIDQIFVRK